MIVMEKRNLLLSEMQMMQTGGEGLALILSVDGSGMVDGCGCSRWVGL